METRRIRRLERRRTHRTAAISASIAAIGVAVGMTLPQNAIASFVLLGAAAACLVVVAARGEARAPLHGLHRIVRLPASASMSATFASLRSRTAGSVRALARLRPDPTPLVLDELDDEADEWWGVRAIPVVAVAPAVETHETPEEDQAVPLPTPVLAAAMPSARVPDAGAGRLRHALDRILTGMRHPFTAVHHR